MTIKEQMSFWEEMKLWDERANDAVGKLIKFAYEETKDIIYSYVDGFGIEHNPIKSVLDTYELDGNAKNSIEELKYILRNYDICNFADIKYSNNVKLAKKIIEFEKSLK